MPCGPINSIDQVLNDPQVQAREMVIDVEHPSCRVDQNGGITAENPYCAARSAYAATHAGRAYALKSCTNYWVWMINQLQSCAIVGVI